MPAPETTDAIWVISDLTPDGTYTPVIQVGPDIVIPLTSDQATIYAHAVFAAAAHADYDAAVVNQLVSIGVGVPAAAAGVAELRANRPAVSTGTRLTFEPIVTARGGHRPALLVSIDGHRFCQWEPADARQHAGQVLDVAMGVPLDAAYYALLVDDFAVPADKARHVVADLANHRQES